jgi:hypothetical protein
LQVPTNPGIKVTEAYRGLSEGSLPLKREERELYE